MSDPIEEPDVCPSCGHAAVIPDDERDGDIECPNCGEIYTLDDWDDEESPA